LAQTSDGTSADTTVAPDGQCLVQSAEIAIQPTSVEYGSMIVGRTAFQTVTLSNTGSQDLGIETLDITGTDNLSFAIEEDNCSNQILPSGEKCTVEILFLPTTKGEKNAFLHVLSNDPVKGDALLSLTGEGILSITLAGPANHASFSGCSIFGFPTFSWEPEELFKKYQIEFSPFASFSGLSMIFRSSKTEARMYASPWKIVLRTPGGTGGPVHWRVVGFRADGSAFTSDSRMFIVEPAEPVGSPGISTASESESPVLSWENNCNVTFRVVFGNDNQFSKVTSISLKAKNPTYDEGEFMATLKANQWKSIRKLVKNETGSRIYWKVESLDGANRSAVTKTMSFVLTD
jgi:hypothetical protein